MVEPASEIVVTETSRDYRPIWTIRFVNVYQVNLECQLGNDIYEETLFFDDATQIYSLEMVTSAGEELSISFTELRSLGINFEKIEDADIVLVSP